MFSGIIHKSNYITKKDSDIKRILKHIIEKDIECSEILHEDINWQLRLIVFRGKISFRLIDYNTSGGQLVDTLKVEKIEKGKYNIESYNNILEVPEFIKIKITYTMDTYEELRK